MKSETIKISVVVTSRNDDHGGDMLKRMLFFVDGLRRQAQRHHLAIELVVVEWNPPAARPRLHDALRMKADYGVLDVRYIQVPKEIHERLGFNESLGIPQWIAKNIGIRRAKGEFILATNMDILFSDALCQYLANNALDFGAFYRANRCDVDKSVLNITDLEEQLNYCKKNVIARHGLLRRPKSRTRQFLSSIKHMLRRALAIRSSEDVVIDIDASGDFFLMSRSSWWSIRGYPEINSHAYIDGLACHTANACGLRQVVLTPEACVYHVAHEREWTTMPVLEKLRMMRTRPTMDWKLYCDAITWLRVNRKPLPVNDERWGFGEETFQEIVCN